MPSVSQLCDHNEWSAIFRHLHWKTGEILRNKDNKIKVCSAIRNNKDISIIHVVESRRIYFLIHSTQK